MRKLKEIIKNSKLLGMLFLGGMQLLVWVMKLFVTVNPKRIIFTSYSGRQISDTPWAAFQILKQDERYADYDFIWAVNQPAAFPEIEGARKVNMNALSFYWHLLSSKYWVANTSIERLIPIHHTKQIYIQFWHGIPMKTLGHAEKQLPWLVQNWYDHAEIDYLFANSSYDAQSLMTLFPKSKQVLIEGQLRKWLSDQAKQQPDLNLLQRLQSEKPVLLYAPTYRGDQAQGAFLSATELTDLMHDYQVIYRGHYFSEHLNIKGMIDGNAFDLYQLFACADVLVTDYSSVFFDFAYWRKPIYLYTPDIVTYQQQRGLALNPELLNLPMASTYHELKHALLTQQCSLAAIDELETTFDPQPSANTVAVFKSLFVDKH